MILRRLVQRQGKNVLQQIAAKPTPINRRFQSTTTTEVDLVDSYLDGLEDSSRRVKDAVSVTEGDISEPGFLSRNTTPSTTSSDNGWQYRELARTKREFSGIGAVQTPHYQPHTLISNPPRLSDVTLELLLASEAHLGHSTSVWNPGNARYIFGARQGIHIISLDVIAAHLRRAAKVVEETAYRGGLILFVGTRAGQDRCVVRAAELAGGCHLFQRWIPGSITNGQQILGHCRMKIVDELDQEVFGLESELQDRVPAKPDLVICLNPMENEPLLHECAMEPIPTIGVIDTNADPTKVTYPIPANDDSIRCISFIAGVLGRAAETGKNRRLEAARNHILTFEPAENLTLPESDAPEKPEKEAHQSKEDSAESSIKEGSQLHADQVAADSTGPSLNTGEAISKDRESSIEIDPEMPGEGSNKES